MNYQWYPGHMTKTVRQIEENIKLIDLVLEIVDARIPVSSRNPDFDKIAKNKARMILMGKVDLADEAETNRWIRWYQEQNLNPYPCDLRKNGSLKNLGNAIREACHEKIERDKRKGIMNRPIKVMVAGIPNVGKSTFINSLSGTSSLKTGNKPGVTKGRQWISIGRSIQLLDTPGLLWPKFENQETGKKIAFIGSIPDHVLDTGELSCELISELLAIPKYRDYLEKRYSIDTDPFMTSGIGGTLNTGGVLDAIAHSQGCLKKGGEADYTKAAAIVLDDFRSGRTGKITLERAPE